MVLSSYSCSISCQGRPDAAPREAAAVDDEAALRLLVVLGAVAVALLLDARLVEDVQR